MALSLAQLLSVNTFIVKSGVVSACNIGLASVGFSVAFSVVNSGRVVFSVVFSSGFSVAFSVVTSTDDLTSTIW